MGIFGGGGWIVLKEASQPEKQIYIFVQSKTKSKEFTDAAAITLSQVEEEREKAFKVPRKLGRSTQLFITDAKRSDLDEAVVTASGETVILGLENHSEYYSFCAFLKEALLKDCAAGQYA